VLDVTERRLQELIPVTRSGTLPVILLTEAEPIKFLGSFMTACAARCPIFLGNPQWGEAEWQQVLAIAQPDLIWGTSLMQPTCAHTTHHQASVEPISPGTIMIPTGGSSGQIRFAIHTWETLMSSVQGFRHYFQVEQVNSCCVLPLYHVSGLMQFLRSLTSGGQLAIVPFKALTPDALPEIDPQQFFLSLVPTQLKRWLEHPALMQWLRQFQTVLLGGAPAWDSLLEQARQSQIRLAPTYGMTETASQVATLKPDDFLQGKTGCGQVLPHAQISVGDRPDSPLPPHQIGKLWIQAASLALGYYPPSDQSKSIFPTDDLGYFDTQGYLHIVGRDSQKIISGGENVFPAEVEAVIRATGQVADVCVLGLPDAEWGERVVAVYVPVHPSVTVASLQTGISSQLCNFKRPKTWIGCDRLPRNSQGKINLAVLKQSLGISVDGTEHSLL
jgi:O-succinylbenzoic acid--CoA ligase